MRVFSLEAHSLLIEPMYDTSLEKLLLWLYKAETMSC